MADNRRDKQQQIDFFAERLRELRENQELGALPGLGSESRIEALARQITDSVRRIGYCHYIRDKHYGNSSVIDPNHAAFNPLKAAVERKQAGDLDEACWLVFLATHFGKHMTQGWRFVREIYGLCGNGVLTWQAIHKNFAKFRVWLERNQTALKSNTFSNHRKYETLSSNPASGLPAVFGSYADWVNNFGGWQALLDKIQLKYGNDPKVVFKEIYSRMKVKRFGRLAKFDYLTMLGKLGIIDIEPDSAYLEGATGPLRGARLLFGGNASMNISAENLDKRVLELGQALGVNMQVMEDSLCNWQKTPDYYKAFRG